MLDEGAVEDDGDDVGVVPQVAQLVGGVAVVRVDHGQAGLEGGEHRLEVLRAVVEVLGDLVLLDDAPAQEMGGDGVGAPVELPPGPRRAGVPLRRRVRQPVGDRLPNLGVVPARAGRSLQRSGGPARRRSLAAKAASISLTAPHIDSIHHVAPADAHAAGECSLPSPSMTMS